MERGTCLFRRFDSSAISGGMVCQADWSQPVADGRPMGSWCRNRPSYRCNRIFYGRLLLWKAYGHALGRCLYRHAISDTGRYAKHAPPSHTALFFIKRLYNLHYPYDFEYEKEVRR